MLTAFRSKKWKSQKKSRICIKLQNWVSADAKRDILKLEQHVAVRIIFLYIITLRYIDYLAKRLTWAVVY